MVMQQGNSCFVHGHGKLTRIEDPIVGGLQLSMLQLARDYESGDLVHLPMMVLREDELPRSLDDRLEKGSGRSLETQAFWLPSMQLGESCNDLVRSTKDIAQVSGKIPRGLIELWNSEED